MSSRTLAALVVIPVRLATRAARAPLPLHVTLDTTRLPALWSARYALPALIAHLQTRRRQLRALATTVRPGRPSRKRCRLDTALFPLAKSQLSAAPDSIGQTMLVSIARQETSALTMVASVTLSSHVRQATILRPAQLSAHSALQAPSARAPPLHPRLALMASTHSVARPRRRAQTAPPVTSASQLAPFQRSVRLEPFPTSASRHARSAMLAKNATSWRAPRSSTTNPVAPTVPTTTPALRSASQMFANCAHLATNVPIRTRHRPPVSLASIKRVRVPVIARHVQPTRRVRSLTRNRTIATLRLGRRQAGPQPASSLMSLQAPQPVLLASTPTQIRMSARTARLASSARKSSQSLCHASRGTTETPP